MQLENISSSAPAPYNKAEFKSKCKTLSEELSQLKYLLRAENKHSILIVLQGMDASGKDGTVSRVFRGVDPLGLRLHSFKKPTDLEFNHDFLWRVHQVAPQKGEIAVFNRSHYEDVLIQRVHNWIDEKRVFQRFEHINNFEKLLQEECNTHILKFYLHVSPDMQIERLDERRTVPRKYWKHNDNDYKEREHWDSYMKAYEDVFKHCNQVPWHIVPSDQNWYKSWYVLHHLVEKLKSLDMQFPPLDSDM